MDQINVDMGKCLLGDGNVKDGTVLVMVHFAHLTGRACMHPCCDIAVHRMPYESVAHQTLGGMNARMQ